MLFLLNWIADWFGMTQQLLRHWLPVLAIAMVGAAGLVTWYVTTHSK